MIEFFNNLCNSIFDPLLLWALRANWTLALFIVALATAFTLAIVRKFTSNQDLLHRAAADKTRLKALIRDAKRRGDKATVKRHKLTLNMIGMKTLKQEGLPLAVSLIPIALLATWCYARLEFLPPRDGAPVTVLVSTPAWAINEPVHIQPAAGLTPEGATWVRQVQADPDQKNVGLAKWTLLAKASPTPYTLTFRIRNAEPITRQLLVGQATYAAPVEEHPGEFQTRLEMPQAKLFGVVPGVGGILPPWLIAYLLIAIPGTYLFRWLLKIA